jgi:hypothetical protein
MMLPVPVFSSMHFWLPGGFRHLFPSIALCTAAFFFALLTLRDKMHLITVDFGNALRHHTLVKAADQLIHALTIASLYFHYPARLQNEKPLSVLFFAFSLNSLPVHPLSAFFQAQQTPPVR